MNGRRRAVFLDRDGVLNLPVIRDGKPYPPGSAAELEVTPGAAEALASLKKAGFILLVVSNQPDVARGSQRRSAVEEMHLSLSSSLPVDEFFVCYHDDSDHCDCRKPRPGLLIQAARRYDVDLERSYLVGDRWRDIEAGANAGCKTVWIDYGYAELKPAVPPDARVSTLSDAADWIVRDNGQTSSMKTVSDLSIKLFADGADRAEILRLCANPLIRGFTTNPTLMRKAGISDYEAFARDVLACVPDRPISFEVLADECSEMERQARKIAAWGENVYVKIPVTNTRREPTLDLVCRLAHAGVKLNVTALLTLDQVRDVAAALSGGASAYISVFAGRIADTGRDPVPLMAAALDLIRVHSNIELIWASPRELLNIFQADSIGCHIITATAEILNKLPQVGKDLGGYSLETVQMFYNDARKSGFRL